MLNLAREYCFWRQCGVRRLTALALALRVEAGVRKIERQRQRRGAP